VLQLDVDVVQPLVEQVPNLHECEMPSSRNMHVSCQPLRTNLAAINVTIKGSPKVISSVLSIKMTVKLIVILHHKVSDSTCTAVYHNYHNCQTVSLPNDASQEGSGANQSVRSQVCLGICTKDSPHKRPKQALQDVQSHQSNKARCVVSVRTP
jgi:hypothetical protein